MVDNNEVKNNDSADVSEHFSGNRKSGMVGLVIVIVVALLGIYLFFGNEEKVEKDAKKEILTVKEVSEEKADEIKKTANSKVNDTSSFTDIEDTLGSLNVDIPDISAPPEITDISSNNLPNISNQSYKTPNIVPPPVYNNDEDSSSKSKAPLVVSDQPTISPPTTIKDITSMPRPSGTDKTRRANPMIAMGGGQSGDKKQNEKEKQVSLTNDDLMPSRSSDQIDPTHLGDMRYIVAQGTLMDAILETPINTDLTGLLRGLVSRDVYAEVGDKVLIPKGSRLIGEYETTISYTQSRVNVKWTRLILPSGLDFEIDDADGTDSMGRAGIKGTVINKMGRMFGNAFLVSSVKLFSGLMLDKLVGDSNVQIKVDGAETTTTGSVMAQLAAEAVTDLTDNLTALIERYNDDKPTILVQQGTKLKVFVNNDMIFPSQLYS